MRGHRHSMTAAPASGEGGSLDAAKAVVLAGYGDIFEPDPSTSYHVQERGQRRDDARPKFERLVAYLETTDERLGVVVSDITRLFRSRRDRYRIDASPTPGVSTSSPSARRATPRSQAAVPATTRRPTRCSPTKASGRNAMARHGPQLADRYLRDALVPWLKLRSVPDVALGPALADVCAARSARRALGASRSDRAATGAYHEVAERHEPADLPARPAPGRPPEPPIL
jgi:hypothetical protein